MTQLMIRGACGLARSIPILSPSLHVQTPLTWMRMRKKCSLRLVHVLPTLGAWKRALLKCLCT